MRIWLDDLRPMPDDYDIHIKKASVLIKLLDSGCRVKHIGFDHDLGDDEDGTGHTVANHIEKMAAGSQIGRMTYSVQSDNSPGRDNIEAAMKSANRFWDLIEHRANNGVYS